MQKSMHVQELESAEIKCAYLEEKLQSQLQVIEAQAQYLKQSSSASKSILKNSNASINHQQIIQLKQQIYDTNIKIIRESQLSINEAERELRELEEQEQMRLGPVLFKSQVEHIEKSPAYYLRQQNKVLSKKVFILEQQIQHYTALLQKIVIKANSTIQKVSK
ncbi:Hypothetical_protein [Hexamita inflata]|uniref:Hypothetical_protein n=1 Tax=Hexamita inflata TaxID=28002 RepID=A0ABP1I6D9_9EUKA